MDVSPVAIDRVWCGGDAVNTMGLCICEICGTQSADHAGWFAVAGIGSHMEVLPWHDELRSREDCRHACCGDHVQQLVFSTATRDFSRPTLALSSVHRGGWNSSSLLPLDDAQTACNSEESILNVLSEIDSILQGPTADEEEQPSFDA